MARRPRVSCVFAYLVLAAALPAVHALRVSMRMKPVSPSISRRSVLEQTIGVSAGVALAPSLASAATTEVEVVKKGGGPQLGPGAYVRLEYQGWLDGFGGQKLIEQTIPGSPIKFHTGAGDITGIIEGTIPKQLTVQVPAGFDEAVSGLTVGSVVRAKIPADRAFGKDGAVELPNVLSEKNNEIFSPRAKVPSDATVYYEIRVRSRASASSGMF